MEKNYDPKQFEERIYARWLDKGYFTACPNTDKKPFTIMMPPPNITGQLHIGHALDGAIQDAVIRYKRMRGYEALFMPGTDHASIATEVKISAKLVQEGTSKEKLGREGFLARAHLWNKQYGGQIALQQRRLGLSCDWRRSAFTMDKQRSGAVREVFVNLYDKGLIYRGDRLVNMCPSCRTALSDAEVEFEDADSRLWYVKYPVEECDEYITVATTRPETMLGDTAVAVNPKDKRYKNLVGKTLTLPLNGRKIPVIADDYVLADFGTGAVKITPAHDFNDFEVGKRHNLPSVTVIDDDGNMNNNAGEFEGLTAAYARLAIVEELQKQGFLLKTEEYKNKVGHCYRCRCVVEPLISKQWFVRMDSLVAPAVTAVKKGKIRFLPVRFKNNYLRWMENTRDWCVSRQLWWGHRIPVYYCARCGKETVSKTDLTKCPVCGGAVTQDEDVLDTWFSSALWPFATLNWPTNSPDLDFFYPTSVLATAYDIIGFWVSRMIFSGLEHTGKIPFSEVLIHGIVRDRDGKKMSKSSGNGVDPLDVIDIYGADVLRISLISGVSMGGDMKYSEEKAEGYRNFMNKLWNASRFVLLNSEGLTLIDLKKACAYLGLAEKWILGRFSITAGIVRKLMDKYEIGLAASVIYEFLWNEFCDWYIEESKISLYGSDQKKRNVTLNVLLYVLRETLKLAHPIIPFITAEIFDQLPNKDAEDIMVSPYPSAGRGAFKTAVKDMGEVIAAIKEIRALRHEMNVPAGKRPALFIRPRDGAEKLVKDSLKYVQKLGFASDVTVIKDKPDGKTVVLATALGEVYIPMGELVDAAAELFRLDRELEQIAEEIARAEGKLRNEGFVSKAPPALIAQEREKLNKFIAQRELVVKALERLKNV
ncbi:MAG: valine--tRNA ligase [Firmicutes bacterium]|nr:valine--tRNA ligase [Bacillota bacterium]